MAFFEVVKIRLLGQLFYADKGYAPAERSVSWHCHTRTQRALKKTNKSQKFRKRQIVVKLKQPVKFFVKTLRLCTLYLSTSLISQNFRKKIPISQKAKSLVKLCLHSTYLGGVDLTLVWRIISSIKFFTFHFDKKFWIFSKLNVNKIFTFQIDEKNSKLSFKNVNKYFTLQFAQNFFRI